jgi:hypothetical protein
VAACRRVKMKSRIAALMSLPSKKRQPDT